MGLCAFVDKIAMRRCVVYRIPEAQPPWFSRIAAQRFPQVDAMLAAEVEGRLMIHRDEARRRGTRMPGTAEYLDALAALVHLQVLDRASAQGNTAWDLIERCVFGKQVAVEG